MEIFAKTHAGMVRDNNEDFFVYDDNLNFFVVADGIGGHNAGEVASELACTIILENFRKHYDDYCDKLPLLLTKSIEKANKAVFMKSLESEEFEGMGTTITLGVLSNGVVYAAHVGDSRMYIIFDGKIKQITKDHTLVNELLINGSISLEEARVHPQKNIITKAVGSSEKLVVDIFEIEVEESNVLLLCSDGLTDTTTDGEILDIINASSNYGEACDNLVNNANDSGGIDNITVMLVSI
ncbi:MAG: Stp1/IreP family PP2C-type Ser/Thr phosphatase [Acidaminobacteraceae bacterium]